MAVNECISATSGGVPTVGVASGLLQPPARSTPTAGGRRSSGGGGWQGSDGGPGRRRTQRCFFSAGSGCSSREEKVPQPHKASNVCVPPAEPPDLLDFWPPEGSSVRNTAALCPSATPPHSPTLLTGSFQCSLLIFLFFWRGWFCKT